MLGGVTLRRRALLLLVASLSAAGCARSVSGPLPPGAPVVLVSIDTLRADHLPAWGYAAVETPAIDALRRDAILFRDAWAHVPLTLPSHVTLFTGQLPNVHGVRDNLGYAMHATAGSLPALLQARGYATGAAVSSYVMRRETGFDRGFDAYDDRLGPAAGVQSIATVQRTSAATTAAALHWLRENVTPPFFLFLHLYDPHEPYDPPEPFRSRYALPYDGEIAAADASVGVLVAELTRLGAYDRSLVVLVSDHGEGLGDHGEDGHGILLYREALHVPLMIKLPRSARAGETISTRVGLVDLLPTLAVLLGLEAPKGLPGRALLTSPIAGQPIYAEPYYPRIHLGWSELRSLVDGRFHYVGGPRPELFDLDADPAEQANLIASQPTRAARFASILGATPDGFAAPAPVDPTQAERLAALGYLGGAAAPTDGPRPDPRERLPVLAEVRRAFRLGALGRDAEAIPLLRRILRDNPGLFDAQHELARALTRLGRFEEARTAYLDALEATPSLAGPLRLALARVCLDLDRAQEALEVLNALPPGQQGMRDAAFLRGDALARLGRMGDAVTAFEVEIGTHPDNAEAWARLAFVRALQGRPRAEVRGMFDAMFARNPRPETAALAARTLDSLGDRAAAEAWRSR